MEKRYQVFVSSTYEDLQEERQEVIHALLELDCIPSGMELFLAANESQWEIIKRVIDDCDYYLLILAGRYGTLSPNGISYTEMEYRYAVERKKPIISFPHGNPDSLPLSKCEATDEGKIKLKAFRNLVEQRLCKHWSSSKELGSVVSRSLVQLIKTTPGIGWIRADELPDKDATLELLKLRKRVEELEDTLARTRITAPKGSESLSQGSDSRQFKFTFTKIVKSDKHPNSYGIRSTSMEGSTWLTWNNIFSSIAPLMISEASEASIILAINQIIAESARKSYSKMKDFDGFYLDFFKIKSDDFQTIKVQLRALGLIIKSTKPKSTKNTETYWTLTPYGDEIMTQLRAIPRKDDPPLIKKLLDRNLTLNPTIGTLPSSIVMKYPRPSCSIFSLPKIDFSGLSSSH